jgi:hypothetical protein
MNRFISLAISISMVIILIAAAFGIQNNHKARDTYMPAEIRYEVDVSANIWPDRYYASAYDIPESRSIHFNGYWSFEPGSYPFAGPVWLYHTTELTLTDVDYTVLEIIRSAAA